MSDERGRAGDAVRPMLGDRVFVLLMALHALASQLPDDVAADWTIEHHMGAPTYADIRIDGHRYRLSIEERR